MSRRIPALLSVFVLCAAGCPAEEPGTSPDGGQQADQGDPGDAGAEPGDSLELTSLSPSEGPLGGGTLVTLIGRGFEDGLSVRFGAGSFIDATVSNATEASVLTPAGASAGAVTVVARSADGTSDSLMNAFRYLPAAEVAQVGFCQLQAQSPVLATTGEATDGIYAIVYVEGVTPGVGAGEGIEGELGWGVGSDPDGFEFNAMTYNLDVDGVSPGDAANDEYGASLTIPTAGTYRYAARFRADSSANWTYCDLNGSDDGTSEGELGVVEVTDPEIATVGFCKTDPARIVSTAAAPQTIEGTVFVAGQTPGVGPGDSILGELVWGASDTAPSTWANVVSAAYVDDADGLGAGDLANDRFAATVSVPQAGSYGFAYRFSVDGGSNWTWCDLAGTTADDGFSPNGVGVLDVTSAQTSVVDFCHIFQDTLTAAADEGAPLVTIEVFDDPATVANGGANASQFSAEVGFGVPGANPALDGAFSWTTMSYKGLRPGVDNNYEYEAGAYGPGMRPADGMYRVVARVRHSNDEVWTYCDVDDADGGFTLDAAAVLTVRP